MTMGRCGKKIWSRTAKNGCAAWLTPAEVKTPPFSNRCARRCTAGAFKMSANKLLVADVAAFCAKHRDIRSEKRDRQVGGVCGITVGSFPNSGWRRVGWNLSSRWLQTTPDFHRYAKSRSQDFLCARIGGYDSR